jgi:hypothetical protein
MEINGEEKSGVCWECCRCGAKASEGETLEHATTLAKAEGFTFRPAPRGELKAWCPECAGVKQMRATDIAFYKKRNIDKV